MSTKSKWDELAADIENMVITVSKEFRNLPEETVRNKSTAEDWSIIQIVGHLVDSASNNHHRFVRLLITDGVVFPNYAKDNKKWVEIQNYQEYPWVDLLAFWGYLNLHLARIIRNVDESCLSHIWVMDEDTSITLAEMMVDYKRHLNDHLQQIRAQIS